MKGKKNNTEFISEFITSCISYGFSSSDDILSLAKEQISDIDIKIKEINDLKIRRSNLLDVISSFESKEKQNNINEIKRLNYYSIGSNLECCKSICKIIENKNTDISVIINSCDKFSQSDILFNIKRLIANKIIHKIGEVILKGDYYEDYIKVICEI